MRYKKNLQVKGDEVYSYGTRVATIRGNKLVKHGYWSMTTSKHINHVAATYGLTVVEGPLGEPCEKESTLESQMRTTGGVAALAEIFCNTPSEKNTWKKRMLKAGLPALDFPADFDQLPEEEKQKRLDAVIKLSKGGAK